MRVTLHFDPSHEMLDPHGGYKVTEVVLRAMIANGAFATRVRVGDLMLKHDYAMWTTDIYSTTQVREYFEPFHTKAASLWLISLMGLWKCFLPLNQIKAAIEDTCLLYAWEHQSGAGKASFIRAWILAIFPWGHSSRRRSSITPTSLHGCIDTLGPP